MIRYLFALALAVAGVIDAPIRRFPDQETLLGMMRDAGLEDSRYHNLAGGIVALHRSHRY